MLHPINIEVPKQDPYCMKPSMDFGKSSLTNIPVKQQRNDYSLKKEAVTYSTTNSENESNDELSDKSNDDDMKKAVVDETEEDDEKPSLINADDIKSYDILCGRDKATFNNVGNRRFRVLISLNIPRYERAITKAEKASVIKYICDIFRNEVGVRFLKKHKNGGGYYELSVSEARKKVGHALRDMSVARQEVKKRREVTKRNSQRQQMEYHRRSIIGQEMDPLVLEPLPISDQQASVESHPVARNQFQQHRDQHSTTAHLMDQIKPNSVPDIIAQQLQLQQHLGQPQQSHHPQQFSNLQEKLLDLQKQQQQLQREREELIKQQQYQQELLELQIRNRRLRRQQEQMQQQENQQQQQQQQQLDDGFHQFDHFFDTTRQPNRR